MSRLAVFARVSIAASWLAVGCGEGGTTSTLTADATTDRAIDSPMVEGGSDTGSTRDGSTMTPDSGSSSGGGSGSGGTSSGSSSGGGSGSSSGTDAGADADASGDADAGGCQVTASGTLTTLASGQDLPLGLDTDGTNVYWVNYDGGQVLSVPVTGGAAVTLATGKFGSWLVRLQGGRLYWTDRARSAVMSVPLAGGRVTTVASPSLPLGLATDQSNVYWEGGGSGVLGKTPMDGGATTTLAVLPVGDTVLAVDQTDVYFATDFLGRVALDGGIPQTLVTGPVVADVALTATDVYWSTYVGVYSMPKTGGPVTILSKRGGYHLAVDQTSVYTTDEVTLRRIAIADGTVTTIACGQHGTRAIALDATSVYWTNTCPTSGPPYCGTVMKFTPK